MRILVLIPALILIGCSPSDPSLPEDYQLSYKTREYDSPQSGHIYKESINRGSRRILTTTTSSNEVCRIFSLNNEAKFIEVDRDLDGFYEAIMVPGDDHTEYEVFTRHPDGTVEPVDEDTLKEMKQNSSNQGMDFTGKTPVD